MKTAKHFSPELALIIALSLTCASGLSQETVKPAADAQAAATDATKATVELVDDLKKNSASDPQLKPLADDLGSKVSALSKSLGTNQELQGQLQTGVKSMLGEKSASSLGSLQKLTQAKLTPEQTTLAKDVYHTGSAYLVQKNLGSLEGSQTEVTQLVGALRKGSATEALPPLKQIGQNAKLTQPQKEFVSSLTDQYAPGLKKIGAFKGLPGFKKSEPATPEKN